MTKTIIIGGTLAAGALAWYLYNKHKQNAVIQQPVNTNAVVSNAVSPVTTTAQKITDALTQQVQKALAPAPTQPALTTQPTQPVLITKPALTTAPVTSPVTTVTAPVLKSTYTAPISYNYYAPALYTSVPKYPSKQLMLEGIAAFR